MLVPETIFLRTTRTSRHHREKGQAVFENGAKSATFSSEGGSSWHEANATKQKSGDALQTDKRRQCVAALVVRGIHDALLIVFRGENAPRCETVPHFFASRIALQENVGAAASSNREGKQ
jgi:hypothetical protein